jgi:hypothetical protein
MEPLRLIDILRSTGPIALYELIMRAHAGQRPEDLQQVLEQLQHLVKAGTVNVRGLESRDLSKLTPQDITDSRNAIVVLSWAGLHKTLAS